METKQYFCIFLFAKNRYYNYLCNKNLNSATLQTSYY